MRPSLRTALPLLALLCASPALAQRSSRPDIDPDGTPRKMQLKPREQRTVREADAALQRAAKVPPVAPETLALAIPERLGGFARKKVDPQVERVGPAMYSRVVVDLEGAEGRQAKLLIVDTAGLPPETFERRLEPLPRGKRVAAGGLSREGREVSGFPAVSEEEGPKGPSRLQLAVAARLLVAVEGARLSADELAAIAQAVDYGRLVRALPKTN